MTFVDYIDALIERFGYYNPISHSDEQMMRDELLSKNICLSPPRTNKRPILWGHREFCLFIDSVEQQKLSMSITNEEDRDSLLHRCAKLFYHGHEVVISNIHSNEDGKFYELFFQYPGIERKNDKQNSIQSSRDPMTISEGDLLALLQHDRLYLSKYSFSKGMTIYFLENGRLKRQKYKSVGDDDRTGIDVEIGGKVFYEQCLRQMPEEISKKYLPNYNNFWSYMYRYCSDQTISEMETYFTEHKDKFKYTPGIPLYANEKITSISQPDIIRYTDNPNKKSFDKIRIEIYVISMCRDELIRYYKENKKTLLRFAYEKIGANKKFQKYGVPLQFLKLYSVGIGSASNLVFDFEIKTLASDKSDDLSVRKEESNE